ncbi:adenosine receptor A2b-like [Porites lutea]|uniref:adenosine receptor A2b-like n=1 Tax=Porites lutea TaxID=51062 RepID=UPI003CC5B86F
MKASLDRHLKNKGCTLSIVRDREFSSSKEVLEEKAKQLLLAGRAFLGNTPILVALHKETSLHPPSKLLYRNRAISDLCVGVILEPTAITYLLSVINEKWEICYYASVINHVAASLLCALSLYTVTAISVDRLLALLLSLRYRQVITLKRTCLSVIVIWIMCIFGTSLLLESFFHFMQNLVLLNSSLNPLLYCWKIREVRQAVKDTRQFF